MRPVTLTLALCLLAAALACSSQGGAEGPKPAAAAVNAAPATPAAQVPQSKTCALLSADELQEVQGESPTDTQGSEHTGGGLSMSQCFYRLPTFSKSVNLEVVRAGAGASAGAVQEYWRGRFHPDAVEGREREREQKEEREREREEELKRERAAGQVREGGHGEEEKDSEGEDSRPQRVPGLGDEAYFTGNRINATLFVLKSDAVLRISVGGPEDRPAKLKKAAALAAKALRKL